MIGQEKFRSFVSQWDVPYVYGMTCGELARMINERGFNKRPCKLTVVPMRGWQRAMVWRDTGLPWVPASPHIPHGESPLFQVATGMLGEVGGVSIGVGYTLPFQTVAAPKVDPQAFAAKLNGYGLPGVVFRPLTYKPYYAAFKDEVIGGVQLHFTDPAGAPLTAINYYALEALKQVAGRDVFSRFKFESGVHRVQRVPDTEAQGRIHTSACTVAILPEVAEIEEVEINKADLRVDTYRASGAGGQHVNRTDSAVRITHIPSGIVVECQDERSQHKNRARAMSLLASKLLSQAQDAQHAQQASERKLQVGSGDRSERIRTYNFPQGRVTDHRVNLTLYRLPEIMEGDLDSVIDPLVHEYQADQLAALGE